MRPERLRAWKTATRLGIVLGIALVVGALAVRDVRAQFVGALHAISLVMLLVGGVMTVACLGANYDVALRLLGRRKTAVGANAVVVTVLAVALTALVCYISSRRYARLDMTGKRRYTLHNKTERMLRGLDRPVDVTVVYVEPPPEALAIDPQAQLMHWGYQQATQMIEEFKAYSPRLTVRELDLQDPTKLSELRSRVDIPGSCVVFESGELHDVIPLIEIVEMPSWGGESPKFRGEAAFAEALARITQAKKQTVCFLTGHGERPLQGQAVLTGMERSADILNTEQYSLSRLVKRLRGDNFESKTVNLSETGTVPEDCDVLVIAGPRTPLPPEQIEAIRRFLQEGNGRAIIMVDSHLEGRGAGSNLDSLLAGYGIKAHADALGMHVSRQYARLTRRGLEPAAVSSIPITEKGYAAHPVTRDLQNYTVELIDCAPLEILSASPKPALSTRSLLTGISGSWGEKAVAADMETSRYDTGTDIAGPVIGGIVVEPSPPPGMAPAMEPKEMPGARLVVFGSSLSFVNAVTDQNEANLYVMLNAVNWLAGKTHMLGIPPRDIDVNLVSVSASQARAARWIFIVGVPACIVALGIAVWQVRRR